MGVRLTDKIVSGLPAPERGSKVFYDAPDGKGRDWTPGFGVRVTAAGARSFIFNFRTKVGRERRLTIGSPPAWTVEAAREEAVSLRFRVGRGEDPLGIAQAGREAATVAGLIQRFLDEHIPKLRASTQVEHRALAQEIQQSIGTLKVAAVEYSDIERLHRAITKRGAPYRANRMLAVLSRMMSLAVKWKMRPDNPCKGVERNAEAKRKRYVDVEGGEMDRLVRALAAHENQQIANVFRLLLLTGARRGEVLSATWGQFDLGRGLWTKPAHATKQKLAHQVPLSGVALDLLRAMRKADPEGDYLFPSHSGSAGGHLTGIKKAWAVVLKRAGIKDLRVHDLRHSYASVLVSAGHSLPTIGALLGHSQPGTTARYAHLFDDVQRRATNEAAAVMAGLVAKPSKRKPLKIVTGGKR
jgi:integrase